MVSTDSKSGSGVASLMFVGAEESKSRLVEAPESVGSGISRSIPAGAAVVSKLWREMLVLCSSPAERGTDFQRAETTKEPLKSIQ